MTEPRTVLVNPAWHCLQNQRTTFIPVGLAYIAGALSSAGHEVQILDGERVLGPKTIDPSLPGPGIVVPTIDRYLSFHNSESPVWETLAREILRLEPHIVGFSMWTASFQSVVNTAKALKRIKPDIITVVGGIHATIDPASVIEQPEIDYVVCGEGEVAAVQLWDLLSEGRTARQSGAPIKGVWTKSNGRIQNGGQAPLLEDIDSLPFPMYEVVKDFSVHCIAGIITARGCPFGCSFCASESLWGRKVRYRSIDRCIAELHHYRDKFGLRTFRINDDTFCLSGSRLNDFCSRIKNDFSDSWQFMVDANVNSLDEEKIALLKDAGCTQINFGIESVADRIRRSFVDKPVQAKHARAMVDELYRAGIVSSAYFMTGFPGETEEEFRVTVDFMEELSAANNIWSVVSPYPGTALYRYASTHGYLPRVSRLHLMHHSLTSNMSKIPSERYEVLIEELEGRVRSLLDTGMLRLNAADLIDMDSVEGSRWSTIDRRSLPRETQCGYVDELGGKSGTAWSASGWAYDPGSAAPAEHVIVLNRGTFLGKIKVRFERPDVANAFHNPELLRTGWKAIIADKAGSIEPSRLEFVAMSKNAPIGVLRSPGRS